MPSPLASPRVAGAKRFELLLDGDESVPSDLTERRQGDKSRSEQIAHEFVARLRVENRLTRWARGRVEQSVPRSRMAKVRKDRVDGAYESLSSMHVDGTSRLGGTRVESIHHRCYIDGQSILRRQWRILRGSCLRVCGKHRNVSSGLPCSDPVEATARDHAVEERGCDWESRIRIQVLTEAVVDVDSERARLQKGARRESRSKQAAPIEAIDEVRNEVSEPASNEVVEGGQIQRDMGREHLATRFQLRPGRSTMGLSRKGLVERGSDAIQPFTGPSHRLPIVGGTHDVDEPTVQLGLRSRHEHDRRGQRGRLAAASLRERRPWSGG